MIITRRVTRILGIAMVLIILAVSVPAAGADSPTRQDIFEALNVDEVPADYVILVDTSGSMNAGGLYGDVQETLAAFFEGLTPADHLAIYTFDSYPTPRYVGSAADASAALDSLPSRPTPNGNTDIGAALAAALDELDRPGAAPVAAVVLLTDGLHEPLPDSPYLDLEGASWDELSARAARLRTSVSGYALSLRGETGAPLLRDVFARTTVLDPTSMSELAEYLNRAKEETRIEKARSELAPDIGQAVVARWSIAGPVDLSGGTASVSVTLQATTTHAPLVVSDLAVDAGGGLTVVSDLPPTIELAAGQEVTLDLMLRWVPQPGPIPFSQRVETTGALTIRGSVSSPWAAALAPEIDLDIRGDISEASRNVTAVAAVGTWLAQAAVAGGVLVLALVVWLLLYLRRPRLSGSVVATTGDNDLLGRFRLKGRRARLRGQSLQGVAVITARRVTPDYRNPAGLEYRIRYRRNSTAQRRTFRSGGSAFVNGVNFLHEEVTGPRHGPREPVAVSSDV